MTYPFKVVTHERVEGYWIESKSLKARAMVDATSKAIKQAKRIGVTGVFAAAVVYQQNPDGEWIQLPGIQVGRPNGSVFTINPKAGNWQGWLAENLGLKN